MPELTDEQWRTFSERLDEALRLPETDRGPWLVALAATQPQVAVEIERKLSLRNRAGFDSFLSGSLLADPGHERAALVGRKLGSWLVESEAGLGPLGPVWCARRADNRSRQRAAVKFVHRYWPGAAAEARFRGRGRQFGRLEHPNIARLLDGGLFEKKQPYLVLEYVEGEPIDAYCARLKLGIPARVALFQSALTAIGYAHRYLVVHRALKPSNIFVTHDGVVKVLDFGIAELLSDDAAAAATQTYSLALTPQYAAPEQLLGHPITTATDVHAAGLVLYLLLTGVSPRRSQGSSAELMRAAIHETPPRASSVVSTPAQRRALSGDLDAILTRALEQDPVRRYASADLFAEDLRRYLANEPVQARQSGTAYRLEKFVRRHRIAVPAAVMLGLCLLGVTLYCLARWQTTRLQRDVAMAQARLLQAECRSR